VFSCNTSPPGWMPPRPPFRVWQFVLGTELKPFESEFGAFIGAGHAVGVASGTDALELALRALAVGPGDDVITVAHTFIPTPLAIAAVGTTPDVRRRSRA
jgi:dTDP-4-amino-4,6-dideoxygalactose transaminase